MRKSFWSVSVILFVAAVVSSACTPASTPVAPSTPAAAPNPAPAPVTPLPSGQTPAPAAGAPEPTPALTQPAPTQIIPAPEPAPAPAKTPFVVSNMTVTPNTIRLEGDQRAAVSVLITNTGQSTGTYTVVLKCVTATAGDPVKISPGAAQTITLAGGESRTVTFYVGVMGNGTHIVSVEDVWGRLTVDSQI